MTINDGVIPGIEVLDPASGGMKIDNNCLEAVALICITALASIAVIVDGDAGEAIAIGCAAGLGAFAKHVWGK